MGCPPSLAATAAARQRRCLLLLLTAVLALSSSDRVPVLIWTNDRSVAFPQHLAGHSVSHHEFQSSYVKDLTLDNQDNIVLFMQDELSAVDFAHFSDVFHSDEEKNSFKNVKSLMSEMTSTFLPSVHNPASVLMEVENLKSRKVKILDDPQDNILLETDDEPQLIIVRLPKLRHHSRKSFSRLDDLIGIVSLQLKALTRPFIAFYTAAVSSKDTSHESHHQGRHLMESSEAVSVIFVNVSDTFYFYTQNLTLGNDSIAGVAVDEKNTQCNDTTGNCEVVLTFDGLGHISMFEPQIRFQFNITSDSFWYLSQFALEYWITPKSNSSPRIDSDMRMVDYKTDFVYHTPIGFSFHCNNLPLIPDTNDSTILSFQFNKFQIQPFVQEGGRFGHYNDCVGFFTIGTWMFLISTAIMIAILFFGIIMLLKISTQDRFDDAKGKTITVTSAEG